VTRQTVLRERVIIRKESVTEVERDETELRRERIEFDAADVPADQIENGIGEPPA
jgi:stress response protein YsnF